MYRYFVRYGLDETYSFIHLTFQEHLAAVYLANLGESELWSTITNILQIHGQMVLQSSSEPTQQTSTLIMIVPHHRQHLLGAPNLNLTGIRHQNVKKLNVMFKFLFGMIFSSKSNAMDIYKLILESNDNNVLYWLSCAFEAQHPSACNYLFRDNTLCIQKSHKHDIWSTLDPALHVNSLDMMHIAYVIKSAGCLTPKISFDNCNFNSEAAIILLQGVGDHQISLKIE